MMTRKRDAFLLVASLACLSVLSCTSPQQNSNSQPGGQSASLKPGRWVAQFRSPMLANAAPGTNLSEVAFYSAISVLSPQVVFVAGDMANPGSDARLGVIVKTTDGGATWAEKFLEIPNLQITALNSVHFVNPQIGYVVGKDVGEDGFILKTTDGGESWAVSRIDVKLPFKQLPTTVFFADAETGWIGGASPMPGEEEGTGGPSAILATTDGGATWSAQLNIPVSVYDMAFLDKLTGWASGSNGIIYHTADGGRSWNKQRTEIELTDGPVDLQGDGVKKFRVSGVQFTDRQNGFAAASSAEEPTGRLLATKDGGVKWSRQWIVADAGLRDIFFVNASEGWALTDRGQYIYHTVNGTRTWLSEPREFEQDVQLFRLGGADAAHVWAVGGGAIFFRVTD
jgi:photosystem II stability/assembly factor-like uncharacterized protein